MDRNSVLKLYEKYKKISRIYMEKKRYNESFECLYYACYLMYAYQIYLCDDELETALKELGERVLKCKRVCQKSEGSCFIFYDSLARDNMALSRQYLEALIRMKVPFVYVILAEDNDAKELVSLVQKSVMGSLEVISKSFSYTEQLEALRTLFEKYSSEKVILHMANGDVVGAAFWQLTVGVEKFYVNHGDEQFWVGKNTLDYLLCYRGTGAKIAISSRGITENKIHIQPYYPAIPRTYSQELKFELPENMVLLFSGGRYVKVYDENNEFVKMIIAILQRNPKAYFLFAGSGDSKSFIEQFRQEGVLDRCKIIPYQKNLMAIMRRIDIYLSTYPINGGLMAQFAALAKKTIVERKSEESGEIEELFPKLDRNIKISYETLEQYHAAVDHLIHDEEARIKSGEELYNRLITEKEFDQNLEQILKCKKSIFPISGMILDTDMLSERLIRIDRRYLHRFWALQLNKYVLKYMPLKFIYASLMFIKYRGWHTFIQGVKKKIKGNYANGST